MEEIEVERILREANENGKADFSMELELKTKEGEVVALVNGIWQLRKNLR
jgi:hypothetical protein